MTTVPSGRVKPAKKNPWSKIIFALVGIAVMVLVFAFLFPQFGDYQTALTKVAAMGPWWIVALGAASLANIVIYPFTGIAAIPKLSYRATFVSRQSGFLLSNVVPGGGAVAVATQYAILAKYGVNSARAAAAVSADAVFTYLFTFGTPAIALLLLNINGQSVTAYNVLAMVGVVIVIVSLIVVITILRSEDAARRIGAFVSKPVGAIFTKFKKPAPNITGSLVTFHTRASEMIATRWPQLTIANFGAQLAPIGVLIVALAGLGAYPGDLSFLEVFAAFSIALLLTAVPLTPGGLGTVDAALVALLISFGLDSSTAIAADLIWRLAWFLPQLLVGLGALGLYWWDRRRQRKGHLLIDESLI